MQKERDRDGWKERDRVREKLNYKRKVIMY